MLNIPITKKYKYVIKRLLKPKGLKKLSFSKPNIVSAIVCEEAVIDRMQILKMNMFLLKYIKKKGALHFPCLKLKSVTQKPVGIRMGKGKGSVNRWVISLKRGAVLFQIEGVSSLFFFGGLKQLNHILPCCIKLISVKF